MRRTLILTTAALVLLLAPAAFAFTTEYTADLSGAEEVPPVATDATGDARLLLSDDGTQLKFRVAVRDLDEITQSHIHLGPRGENGPVVAFLFGFVEEGVSVRDGILSTGVITADDLVGPLEGQPLSALVDALNSGNAYVNVHTIDHPGGEIRGQVE